jgi:hypothetical protein
MKPGDDFFRNCSLELLLLWGRADAGALSGSYRRTRTGLSDQLRLPAAGGFVIPWDRRAGRFGSRLAHNDAPRAIMEAQL